MAASNLFQKECRIRTSRLPFFATETARTISKYPCAFVYSEQRKYNQVRIRYKHFYGLIFTILQRKSTFLVISMSFGVIHIFSAQEYLMQSTLLFHLILVLFLLKHF